MTGGTERVGRIALPRTNEISRLKTYARGERRLTFLRGRRAGGMSVEIKSSSPTRKTVLPEGARVMTADPWGGGVGRTSPWV